MVKHCHSLDVGGLPASVVKTANLGRERIGVSIVDQRNILLNLVMSAEQAWALYDQLAMWLDSDIVTGEECSCGAVEHDLAMDEHDASCPQHQSK